MITMFPSAPCDKNIIRWLLILLMLTSLIDDPSRDANARMWLVRSFMKTSQDEDEDEDKLKVVDVPL